MNLPGIKRRILRMACSLCIMIALPSFGDILKEGIFSLEYHADDADLARRSMTVLQTAMQDYAPVLPAQERSIHVRISHTIQDFARYTGGYSRHQVLGIARSAQGMIVVKSPEIMLAGEQYTNTLRHELVHVLLERNTDTATLPRWLNEGIAMRLSGEFAWGSSFRVGKMYLSNQLIDYPYLDFTFIAPGSNEKFSDAYAQALSMTRHLEDTLGEERFWAVVKGCDSLSFPAALREHGGMSVLQFWENYIGSLWVVALVGTFSAGSFFLPMPFILMLAYWRRRRRDKAILEQWEAEEALTPYVPPEPEYYEEEVWDEDQFP